MKTIKVSEINNEKDIIWFEDPTQYEYVRESTYMCVSKNYKPVKGSQGKLIGFEKPGKNKDMPSGIYHGVYYWLKPHDKGMPNAEHGYGNSDKNENFHPEEAVKFIE